ncbi:MAG: penicillin-binding transpeptidase domain-containing protein [Dorea formicigenerans]
MRNVVLVSHSSTFSDINRSGFQLSGKTGTAQQSKTHPDHALFIGFAPSDSPELLLQLVSPMVIVLLMQQK